VIHLSWVFAEFMNSFEENKIQEMVSNSFAFLCLHCAQLNLKYVTLVYETELQ